MNYYEQELRKIVQPQYPDATYVGRACYVNLGGANRAKIQFAMGIVSNQYDSLQITILNRNEGAVDNLRLRFLDLIGSQKVKNPNFPEGVNPHIWDDCGDADWYVYHPNAKDYQKLGEAVSSYLDVFQEQTLSEQPQWQQTM